MGIEVATVTERHVVIQQVLDSHGVVSRLAMSRWPRLTHSVCLRFVEPWGDAVFNQTQIPELLEELRAEINAVEEAKVKDHLMAVACLVETAIEQTHVYVKFIGD
jgi:hypothetical protein